MLIYKFAFNCVNIFALHFYLSNIFALHLIAFMPFIYIANICKLFIYAKIIFWGPHFRKSLVPFWGFLGVVFILVTLSYAL